MKKILIAMMALSMSNTLYAGMGDDPLLGKVMINQMETRSTGGQDPFVFEADAWLGKDINKAWFKLDLEKKGSQLEKLELQALYSRAISTFWDFQVGIKRDFRPSNETRNWGVIGFKGLAPYFFELDTSLYIGENGRTAFNLDAEYEVMLTQRLVLTPELQVNFFGKSDAVIGQGSGLSDAEFGIRLRYEFVREFAPYIGVNWEHKFGQTADFARSAGEATRDMQIVMGVKAWF